MRPYTGLCHCFIRLLKEICTIVITALLPLLPDAVLLLCVLFALVNETVAVHLTDGEAAPSRKTPHLRHCVRRVYPGGIRLRAARRAGYATLCFLFKNGGHRSVCERDESGCRRGFCRNAGVFARLS